MMAKPAKAVTPNPNGEPLDYWQEDEDQKLLFLVDNKYKYKIISSIIGRTETACRNRYKRLQSRIDEEDSGKTLTAWTKPHDDILVRMYNEGRTHREIAIELNRTLDSVRHRVKRIKHRLCEQAIQNKKDKTFPASSRHRRTNKISTTPRKCLRCQKQFDSEGPQHRMCVNCRGVSSSPFEP